MSATENRIDEKERAQFLHAHHKFLARLSPQLWKKTMPLTFQSVLDTPKPICCHNMHCKDVTAVHTMHESVQASQ